MATNDPDLTEALSQLSSNRQPLSKRLKPFIPAIEEQIANGVPMEEIVALLKDRGFDITVEYLRTILYRHRKAQRQKGVKKPESSQQDKPATANQEHKPDGNPANEPGDVEPAIDNSEKDSEDGTEAKPESLEDVFARQRKNEYTADHKPSRTLLGSRNK